MWHWQPLILLYFFNIFNNYPISAFQIDVTEYISGLQKELNELETEYIIETKVGFFTKNHFNVKLTLSPVNNLKFWA